MKYKVKHIDTNDSVGFVDFSYKIFCFNRSINMVMSKVYSVNYVL